jgi:hypothetical protein
MNSQTRVSTVLGPRATLRPMDEVVSDDLMDEIGRYLEAVALFRALGHEPSWRSEQ